MKINWNFQGGRGCKTKTFHGGSMDILKNCTTVVRYTGAPTLLALLLALLS